MKQPPLTRRQTIRTTGLVGGMLLAGCSSGDDGNETERGDEPGDTSGDGNGADGGGPCAGISNAINDTTRWDGAGTDSLVTFAYPTGWGPDSSDDFSEEHSLVNVGNRFGEDGPSLDIQVRTYYAPAESGHVDTQLENPNKSAVEYEYDGETRTAAVTDVIDETIGPGAELTVPNPETGQDHRVSIIPTLNGGPCAAEVRELVIAMVESLEPNDNTTFEAN